MVTIVLLNYNGWRDTTECLESLLKQTTVEWRAIVADNGSEDDSLVQLERWTTDRKADKTVRILLLGENYGFAKGNNKAIEAIRNEQTDYYWILNNDTVVEPDCLEKMVRYMDTHPDITALTPAICLYDQRDCLWNAGGRLVFGGRRYYGSLQPYSTIKGISVLPITFITGCALLVRKESVTHKALFTERFFFGEEDFDFSLRMQAEGRKMVCLHDAVIYHKVSATIGQEWNYNKLFIHTMNRAINLKSHYSPLKYTLWRLLYFPYTRWRFLTGLNRKEQNRFMELLRQECAANEGVSKSLYEKYIHFRFRDDA
ncbi:MAG: glycosyltransferase family 2 protein [Paludibacteraceae bacterium]|nr:glycosyltransferase family 2 protein [Paludibacteraceae bacterium]